MPDQTTPDHLSGQPAEPVLAEEAAAPQEVSIPVPPVPRRRSYQNRTARLLNGVFVTSLVIMLVYFLFQAFFSFYSYQQQGAPISVSILYTLVSLAVPIVFCFLPFLFKFFAEVVELLDGKR